MSHVIHENCVGCTACLKVCPVDAITGATKVIHSIDPKVCIDCGACTYACPVGAIENHHGSIPPRIKKRADWPKPIIDPVHCTGCNFCVDICPFDCLELDSRHFEGIAVLVNPKECVGCRLCESVCAKDAISFPELPFQAEKATA